MPIPSDKFPLRVRYAGTEEVHAARGVQVGGHRTVCLLWLDPERPHIWCTKEVEATCTKCIERMGPPPLKHSVPGTVGTLQERLAEVIENEVPVNWFPLVGHRVAETVESWRHDIAERARDAAVSELNSVYSGQIPDSVGRDIADAVLLALDLGDHEEEEG
jgi:hypothetical protein